MITAIYNYAFPSLDIDDKYILREQSIDDSQAFFDYYADPEVSKHILAKTPSSLKEAKEEVDYCQKLFRYRQGIYWAIACKDSNQMIGAIGIYINNHHHRGELCYDLHRNYWRKGIMTRAVRTAMQHMFKYSGLHRIEAITIEENKPSIAFLNKLGFTHEGRLKNYRYYNNKPHDVEMFGMTKKQFQDTIKEQNLT